MSRIFLIENLFPGLFLIKKEILQNVYYINKFHEFLLTEENFSNFVIEDQFLEHFTTDEIVQIFIGD